MNGVQGAKNLVSKLQNEGAHKHFSLRAYNHIGAAD